MIPFPILRKVVHINRIKAIERKTKNKKIKEKICGVL